MDCVSTLVRHFPGLTQNTGRVRWEEETGRVEVSQFWVQVKRWVQGTRQNLGSYRRTTKILF